MKKHLVPVLLLTLFTLALTRVIDFMLEANLFSEFSSERQALDSYEFTDFAFGLRPDKRTDQRIVLVNIGRSRQEIAEQIQSLSSLGPKVIGIVSFFNCPSCPGTPTDTLLSQAIKNAGNIVLASEAVPSVDANGNRSDDFDSLLYSDPMFSDFSKSGFSNLFATAVFAKNVVLARTCRDFVPVMRIDGKTIPSFAAAVVGQFDSNRLAKLRKRNNPIEFINFRGNAIGNSDQYPGIYPILNTKKIRSGQVRRSDIENKIVLIGFLGDSLNVSDTQDEKFYTPLNYFPIGRSAPDMYSTVIHANVISMILDNDYINLFSRNGEYAFAFIICLFHILTLLIVSEKTHLYFDLISLGLVLLIAEVLSLARLEIFTHLNYKADLNVTLGTLAVASIVVSLYNGLFKSLTTKYRSRKTAPHPHVDQAADKAQD